MSMIPTLPASIPYLEPHGANWAIFAKRFQYAMKATRRWPYFTGRQPCPKPKDAGKPTASEIDAAEEWEYEDMVASYLLSLRLPDTIVMHLSGCCTAFEKWEAVSQDYQAKSAYTQADLHRSFMEMRCAKGEDVREFLASLCYRREELATAGVKVTKKEYERTILCSIPSELATFASQLLSSALIIGPATSIDPDALHNQICEEADRLKSRRARGQPDQGAKRETTEAFEATESDGRRQRKGKCRKCGEEGHWARECCTPKREGNATVPATQASLGATAPPNTQHVGEAHTFLAIDTAEEFWLVEEVEVAHTQMVSVEPDLTRGHPQDTATDAHVQLVSTEPDPLPGKSDSLEDHARTQPIGAEPNPTWRHPEDPVADAHAHLESAEPEILMNAEDDSPQEVEEVEEEVIAKVTAAVDKDKDPRVDLQGLGVSHLPMLKGANALTSPLSQPTSTLLRTKRPPTSPAIETGTRATGESRRGVNIEPPPLDQPPPAGAAEPPDSTVPEQIQSSTQVERPSESLRGKNLRRAPGQESQASAHALEGQTPLGTAHGRPPDPVVSYTRGSTVLEQKFIGPKALVRIHQKRRPVVDESARAHIDPWPDPGTTNANPDAYFEASALLEGEQKHILPSTDSEQAVAPKTFLFSSWSFVLPPPDTLKRDLKPGAGVEPEQRDAAQRLVRLKPPDRDAEDPDEAGGARQENTPAMLDCPQLALTGEEGDIEAPNARMVEAQHKAKWPPPGQATKRECRPDWSPRSILRKPNTNALKGTGTCKPEPEDELAVLKSTAPGNLEVKTSYTEGESPRKTPADPQRPHFEVTESRSRASSPAEKEDILQNQNQVSMAGIDYSDAHTPSLPFSIALGHSCSGYPHPLRAWRQGCHYHRHRWKRQGRQTRHLASHTSLSRMSHTYHACQWTHRTHQGSPPRSSERTHQYTKHLPAVLDHARNEGEC